MLFVWYLFGICLLFVRCLLLFAVFLYVFDCWVGFLIRLALCYPSVTYRSCQILHHVSCGPIEIAQLWLVSG
jgi:hypothetical protein